jgi:hypothetical protein
LSGASNEISIPSNPCLPSSRLSSVRSDSSRSASIVFSGTVVVDEVIPALDSFFEPAGRVQRSRVDKGASGVAL